MRRSSASFDTLQMVLHGARRCRFALSSLGSHETRVIRHGQDRAYDHETHNDVRPRRLNNVW
jgi:hypothetical protein